MDKFKIIKIRYCNNSLGNNKITNAGCKWLSQSEWPGLKILDIDN
jgi:hypothetical protein